MQGGKMASNQLKHAIGTLPSRQSAEQALNQLRIVD